MKFRDEYEKYKETGERNSDMTELQAQAFDLCVKSLDEGHPIFLHQEKARKDDCALINVFRDGGINRFGLFAYEGEDASVIIDMQNCGYEYASTGDLCINKRLFVRCMMFIRK